MDFNNAKASEAIMMPSWQWNLRFFKVYETSNKIIWWLSLILASNEWNDYKHQWLMQKRNHRDLTQEFGKLIMTYHVLVTHILFHIYPLICYYSLLSFWAKMVRLKPWHCCKGRLTLTAACRVDNHSKFRLAEQALWHALTLQKSLERLLAPARHHSSPRKNLMWVVSVVFAPMPVVALMWIDTSTRCTSTVACCKTQNHLWKQTLMNTTNTTHQFPKGFDSVFKLVFVVPSSELDHSRSGSKEQDSNIFPTIPTKTLYTKTDPNSTWAKSTNTLICLGVGLPSTQSTSKEYQAFSIIELLVETKLNTTSNLEYTIQIPLVPASFAPSSFPAKADPSESNTGTE